MTYKTNALCDWSLSPKWKCCMSCPTSIMHWHLWSEEGAAVDNSEPIPALPLCPLLSIKSLVRPHWAPPMDRMCKPATADAAVCQLFFSYGYTLPQLQLFQWWWWGKMAPTHSRLPHPHLWWQGAEWSCYSLHMFSKGGTQGAACARGLYKQQDPPHYSRHCAEAPSCLCLILVVHVTTTWYHLPPLISEKSEETRN